MQQKEKVLLIVHLTALKQWTQKDNGNTAAAQALLNDILAAQPYYDRVVEFEYDPWEPEWNPKKAEYSYDDLAQSLLGTMVTVSGVQKDLCVSKVCGELRGRSIDISVDEPLTINSVYLK